MTSTDERQTLITLIQAAWQNGCRLEQACNEAEIDLRTYRRWYRNGKILEDKRPISLRPAPVNRLTEQERQTIIDISNQPEYANLPPTHNLSLKLTGHIK
ncbi:hypothetical protein [Thalassotalea fusca]